MTDNTNDENEEQFQCYTKVTDVLYETQNTYSNALLNAIFEWETRYSPMPANQPRPAMWTWVMHPLEIKISNPDQISNQKHYLWSSIP